MTGSSPVSRMTGMPLSITLTATVRLERADPPRVPTTCAKRPNADSGSSMACSMGRFPKALPLHRGQQRPRIQLWRKRRIPVLPIQVVDSTLVNFLRLTQQTMAARISTQIAKHPRKKSEIRAIIRANQRRCNPWKSSARRTLSPRLAQCTRARRASRASKETLTQSRPKTATSQICPSSTLHLWESHNRLALAAQAKGWAFSLVASSDRLSASRLAISSQRWKKHVKTCSSRVWGSPVPHRAF